MKKFEDVTTHDIKLGDIVWSHGMRLRVVGEPKESRVHGINEYSPTIYADAVIENWEDVKGYVGNLARRDPEGVRHWTVQGNGLARWSREVDE